LAKIKIVVKNSKVWPKAKFYSKSKFLAKIEIFVKNRKFSQKSKSIKIEKKSGQTFEFLAIFSSLEICLI